MISHELYKWLHLVGLLFVFLGFGAALLNSQVGTTTRHAWYSRVAATHGIGLVLLLIAGFGMIARLGIEWPWPAWVWTKLGIWLALGGLLTVANKVKSFASLLWWLIPALGAAAAALGVFKPGSF